MNDLARLAVGFVLGGEEELEPTKNCKDKDTTSISAIQQAFRGKRDSRSVPLCPVCQASSSRFPLRRIYEPIIGEPGAA